MTSKEWIEINKVFISLPKEKLLAIAVYGEARGESIEGMKAVINVIKNRVIAGGWFIDKKIAELSTPTHGVILKRWQFSCFLENDPNRKKLEDIANLWLKVSDTETTNKLKKYTKLETVYILAIEDFEDNTDGATHYFAKHIEPPKWVNKYTKVAEIGNHIFYK